MKILVDNLVDLPVRQFCSLASKDSTYNEYIYLVNSPIRTLHPERSENKILLGTRGYLTYLNAVSYNLGYIFTLPKSDTIVYPTHILIGSTSALSLVNNTFDNIGPISTVYVDSNLIVLQNKKYFSFIILPQLAMDIPEPVI